MTSDEVNIQLTTIRENLPSQYSQSAARKLMSSYENYKHILQAEKGRGRILWAGEAADNGGDQ
jgi:hypothetical protein